jgi:hypothetical protein
MYDAFSNEAYCKRNGLISLYCSIHPEANNKRLNAIYCSKVNDDKSVAIYMYALSSIYSAKDLYLIYSRIYRPNTSL